MWFSFNFLIPVENLQGQLEPLTKETWIDTRRQWPCIGSTPQMRWTAPKVLVALSLIRLLDQPTDLMPYSKAQVSLRESFRLREMANAFNLKKKK